MGKEILLDSKLKEFTNIQIVQSVNVFELYIIYKHIGLIITDSGGIQEEACSFSIPVIVTRENTERTESIEKGYSFLSTCYEKELISYFNFLINKPFRIMESPYGDGKAASRIINYLENQFRLIRKETLKAFY